MIGCYVKKYIRQISGLGLTRSQHWGFTVVVAMAITWEALDLVRGFRDGLSGGLGGFVGTVLFVLVGLPYSCSLP